MKHIKKIYLSILLGFLLLTSVSAFMPPTHKYIDYRALAIYNDEGGSSEIYETCATYPNECYVGNVLTDISVAYYYVNKGAKYAVTHSPGFCTSMMGMAEGDIERACAIGSCLHAAEDHVSHTRMVPYAITHSGLVNEVIHVFAEQKLDNYVQKNYPEVINQIKYDLTEDNWNNCIPLVEDVLEQEYTEDGYGNRQETRNLINTFISEVKNSINPEANSSYDIAFENKVGIFQKVGLIPLPFLLMYLGTGLLFGLLAILLIFRKNKTILNWISIIFFGAIFIILAWLFIALMQGNAFATLISFVKPISGIVPIGGSEVYLEDSISNVHRFFDEGEAYIADSISSKAIIASGFTELNAANAQVRLLDYFIAAVAISLLILLIWKNFKKTKKGYSFKL